MNETDKIVDTRAASETCVALTNSAVAALAPGESFILVADHDPVGLKYMLAAEQPGVSGWEDLESEPGVWRARISRLATKA
jgi:uncharacterized protein (DUF2249 family)